MSSSIEKSNRHITEFPLLSSFSPSSSPLRPFSIRSFSSSSSASSASSSSPHFSVSDGAALESGSGGLGRWTTRLAVLVGGGLLGWWGNAVVRDSVESPKRGESILVMRQITWEKRGGTKKRIEKFNMEDIGGEEKKQEGDKNDERARGMKLVELATQKQKETVNDNGRCGISNGCKDEGSVGCPSSPIFSSPSYSEICDQLRLLNLFNEECEGFHSSCVYSSREFDSKEGPGERRDGNAEEPEAEQRITYWVLER